MTPGNNWFIPSIINWIAIAHKIKPIVLEIISMKFFPKILENQFDIRRKLATIELTRNMAITAAIVLVMPEICWEYNITVVATPGPTKIGIARGTTKEATLFFACLKVLFSSGSATKSLVSKFFLPLIVLFLTLFTV